MKRRCGGTSPSADLRAEAGSERTREGIAGRHGPGEPRTVGSRAHECLRPRRAAEGSTTHAASLGPCSPSRPNPSPPPPLLPLPPRPVADPCLLFRGLGREPERGGSGEACDARLVLLVLLLLLLVLPAAVVGPSFVPSRVRAGRSSGESGRRCRTFPLLAPLSFFPAAPLGPWASAA